MSFEITRAIFTPHPAEWTHFTSSETGPIGRDIFMRGIRLRALAQQSVGKRTGKLQRSITCVYHRGLGNPYVVVGSDESIAYDHHEGTPPHVITAQTGRLLRFKVGGKIVYAQKTNHPGTQPNRFLTKHLHKVV